MGCPDVFAALESALKQVPVGNVVDVRLLCPGRGVQVACSQPQAAPHTTAAPAAVRSTSNKHSVFLVNIGAMPRGDLWTTRLYPALTLPSRPTGTTSQPTQNTAAATATPAV